MRTDFFLLLVTRDFEIDIFASPLCTFGLSVNKVYSFSAETALKCPPFYRIWYWKSNFSPEIYFQQRLIINSKLFFSNGLTRNIFVQSITLFEIDIRYISLFQLGEIPNLFYSHFSAIVVMTSLWQFFSSRGWKAFSKRPFILTKVSQFKRKLTLFSNR